ncbi:MAG TPA: Uma2 family endonuclease [Gemmataceae bacterium]|nr:Uma2 family endonuclease [Gemmataceae bacterium]
MATVQTPPRNCLLLHDVDWKTYTQLLRAFAERPAVRLTYDRGDLEIMSPLPEHEDVIYLLGRFIDTLTEELGLPVKGGGSTTLRRRKKQRGLDPDKCYWITNESKVRGKKRLNLRVDPPPDLALEVDVTRSSLDRMKIYAKLGVPEVWRLDDPQTLTFNVLGKDGKYAQATHSLAFPLVTPAELLNFLGLRGQMDHNAIVREFRNWIRQRLAGGGGAPPAAGSS